MSKQIPNDRRLTEEERAYLLMRGEDSRVKAQDDRYPEPGEEEELEEEELEGDTYDQWTVADLQGEIRTRVESGAEITPSSSKKADLIAALREHDAAVEAEEAEE